MVREWSYITPVNLDSELYTDWMISCKRYYSFKVFKKSIKFRKHTTGITRFKKRRKQVKRRRYNHLSLWFSVLKGWTLSYSRFKQLWRFYQSYSFLKYTLPSADIIVFTARYSKLSVSNPVNLFSISKSVFGHLLNINPHINNNYLINTLSHSNNAYSLLDHPSDIDDLNNTGATVCKYDSLYYTVDHEDVIAEAVPVSFWNSSLRFNIEIYKILVKLTIFQTLQNL